MQLEWMTEKALLQQGFHRFKLLLLGEMRKGPYLQKKKKVVLGPFSQGASSFQAHLMLMAPSSQHKPVTQQGITILLQL